MYNRSVFGARFRYTRSCEGKDCIHRRRSLQCSIGMESGTLPLTSPSQRILSEKLRYPCFSQVPAGSDCPLPCLYCISRYNSLIVTVLLFAGLLVPAGSDCPLPCLYCSCRFNSLIVTVLNSTGFQQVTGSDCPSYRPIIHQSLHLIGFYSSSFRKFASIGLGLPSFMPILHKYNSLIVTVLLFAGFRKYRTQIAPL